MLAKRFLPALALLAAATLMSSCQSWSPGSYEEYLGATIQMAAAASQPARPGTRPLPATMGLESLHGRTLHLSVDQAVLLALADNRALAVEKINPAIFRTQEQIQQAAFDPVLTAGVSYDRQRVAGSVTATDGVGDELIPSVAGAVFLPTGTAASLDLASDFTWSKRYSDQVATRAGLTVTQSLLRGAGREVNLASLRQARLDSLASQYELRGFAESLVADVENTYWDYALAQRQIEIFENSLQLAQQQLRETQDRIEVGKLAETELAAAQAEVALRREDVINARSSLDQVRLQLMRLLNPPGEDLWQRRIEILNPPAVPEVKLASEEEHAQVALRMRPDLNQARLRIQRGDLEIVKTRNGLLPKLDLFVTLGKTGYAQSFGGSLGNLSEGSYDVLAGVLMSYPPQNRDAQARHQAAVLGRRQAQEAVENLAQLVQVDVRSAYVEVIRAREQVTATAATRRLQEEKLRAEVERFRVGNSTAVLVAVVQRDLLASQISEVQAVVNYLKALVNLHYLEGSLLERWQIEAPGAQPVTGNERFAEP